MIWLLIAIILSTAVWILVESCAVFGLLAAVSGEELARCPRCHHFGMTVQGQMHACRCPEKTGTQVVHGSHAFRPGAMSARSSADELPLQRLGPATRRGGRRLSPRSGGGRARGRTR